MVTAMAAPAAATGTDGAEPLHGRRWRTPTLDTATGLLLTALAFLIGSRTIEDNSFLTHLATGRIMLEELAVPAADGYSFSARGNSWVVQSWLASGLYAGLERLPGLWAVRGLHGALTAMLLAAVWRLTGPIRSLIVRVALVAAPLGVGVVFWSPRPLLFGLVGIGLVLRCLAGQLRPAWLLPVFAVWGATHGTFPIGLALIAAAAVGASIDRRRFLTEHVTALLWSIGGTLTVLVGPLGLDGLLFPLHLLGKQENLSAVLEWQPPSYRSPAEWVYVMLVLAVGAVFARRGATYAALLPSGLALLLGLMAIRNLPIASLVLAACVVPSLSRQQRGGGIDPDERGPLPAAFAVTAGLLGLVAMGTIATSDALKLDRYPVEEIEALDAAGLTTDPAVRILTHDYVGNYLTLRHGTDAQVFLDDRYDMYPASVVRDYVTAHRGGDGDLQAVLDRWQPDVVLWERDTLLRHWLADDPRWDLVDESEDYVVFCRNDGPVRARCS